ncbi:MAG: hypothetical protein PHC64_02575 [Candidatus Gastranaerophilales bacterium]|nr:hypothetical protein [Candidatus Gastranaerophilales bacterium]
MIKNKTKSGTISTELAIGIGLAVVVLFVVLGLFSDNLSTLVSNTNLKNIFDGNDKTSYTSFNRDYSDTQVNVQTIGEQGLAMLRKTANNKAIVQIAKLLSNADTTAINVNSIVYLSKAIDELAGEPHICVYMKKESLEKCNNEEIGGYNYKVTLDSSSLTIEKVNKNGTTVELNRVSTISSAPAAVFRSFYPNAAAPQLTKYQFIKDLSGKSQLHVYSHVLLIRLLDYYQNREITTSNSGSVTTSSIVSVTSFLEELKAAIRSAYERNCPVRGSFPICGKGIDQKDFNILNSWTDNLISKFTTNTSKDEIVSNFKNSISPNIISRVNDDVSSCSILVKGLVDVANDYSIPLSEFGITQTDRGYTLTAGNETCSASSN